MTGFSAYGCYKTWNSAFNTAISIKSGTACFVAGTTVLTEDGEKPIEEIRPGDRVFASNPETGESEYKEVLQTFVNETSELVHIYVNSDEIVSTPRHPFYVPQKGWTRAVNLKAGDILVLSNGEYVVVEKVQHEILEAPVKVYNFEVQDFHTYYVGKNSILVHNKCENDIDTYASFNKKSEKGDGIDGHELLQNAWLKKHGYVYRRGNGLSRQNIALGLTEEQHKLVTELQREAGMFSDEYLSRVSWQQNVVDNMYILSEAGVSQSVIDKFYYYCNIFALKNRL